METFDSAAADIEPLKIQINSFLKELEGAGYAQRKQEQRRFVIMAFSQWARAKRIAIADASEVHL